MTAVTRTAVTEASADGGRAQSLVLVP